MRTSAELQALSVRRKLIYFGIIIVLFTLITFSGSLLRALTGRVQEWTIASRAAKLQLTEVTQGHADVAGSSVRLLLTGSRGFAVCFLWVSAQEMQKRHEWNKLEVVVETITKLQPHFLTPWLFQSWNLSYNVSVESDRVRDKYFYIAKGIQLLAAGERINRGRGYDEEGEYETGNPDMRYWIGFYYMNKFGASDENNTLRSLFQMSCMNPAKRSNLRDADGRVDLNRFREFVKENPILVRRLREHLKCNTPDEVADFIVDNREIPTRYEQTDTGWRLKSNTAEQFPIVPDKVWDASKSGVNIDLGTLRSELSDDYGNYHAAFWWMCFAQDPLPPYEKGKPARATPPEKPLRHRLPRQPMLILFRQSPPRCLTYVAEFLQKEGWFDESGWVVDEGRASAPWFRTTDGRVESLVVGADPRYGAKQAWDQAYKQWSRHGEEHGMILDPAMVDRLESQARLYRQTYMAGQTGFGPELSRSQVDPAMWASYDAHMQLIILGQNLSATNFKHFLYQAHAESDPRIVQVRKLFYEAERQRLMGNPEMALRKYDTAFDQLRGNSAEGRRGLLEQFPNFRTDNMTQEELVERQLEYVRLLYEHRGIYAKTAVTLSNLLHFGSMQSGVTFSPGTFVAATLFHSYPDLRQLPLFVGPLDGVDSEGNRWLEERVVFNVKSRLGLIQMPAGMPAAGPGQPLMP